MASVSQRKVGILSLLLEITWIILFRFDPDASDSDEDNNSGHIDSSKRPQPQIPICTCDNCPSVEGYEECCRVETKASDICQGQ